MIKLIDNEPDTVALCEWLSTNPQLTQGPLVKRFEEKFSDFIGRDYSVFVNSGSSAILLGLYSLIESNLIKKGDRVGVPAICWATDLAPLKQLGLEPVLIDVDIDTLSIGLNSLEAAAKEIKVLLMVSVLGLVPDMDSIEEICLKNGVILLEDTCESLGSSLYGRKLGTWGTMSFFSTFWGHHISTIEGGFVSTDNFKTYELLKMLRAHGWDRDLSQASRARLRTENAISDFDSLYTFYGAGFNFRNTEIGAFLGLEALKGIDKATSKRNVIGDLYRKTFDRAGLWTPKKNGFESFFAYPLILPEIVRLNIAQVLQLGGIECRPLIAGSIEQHPLYQNNWGTNKTLCPNAKKIHQCGMYIPCHESVKEQEAIKIAEIIIENLQ